MDNLLDLKPLNERICKIVVKLKYYNLMLIVTYAPTEEKDEVIKEEFYSRYVMRFAITTWTQY